jgi:hypothetical protein
MPLNVRAILQILAVNTASNATANWTYVPGPGAVNENTNPTFNRTVKTTAQGVLITRGGTSCGYPMETLCLGAAQVNPALTWPPVCANQPTNSIVGYGNAANFISNWNDEITNGGGNDISYQWEYAGNGANVISAGVYSNATTNYLNISSTAGLSNVGFLVAATNPSGTTDSSAVFITTDPTILTQPTNTNVVHPAAANFSVVATGQTTLSYLWCYGNGTNVPNTGVYSGNQSNVLNVSNSTGLNGTNFFVTVSDTGGSQNSANAFLLVS